MHCIKINISVIICFYDKLCLIAELGDPQLAHDVLVGEVTVGVHEGPLNKVTMLFILYFQQILISLCACLAKQEHQPCISTTYIGSPPSLANCLPVSLNFILTKLFPSELMFSLPCGKWHLRQL